MPPEQPEERYKPLALISVTLIALLGFAVFFLSFLVAPLAILLIFYVGFAASDRSKRGNGNAAPPAAVAPAPEADVEYVETSGGRVVEERRPLSGAVSPAVLARQRADAETARAAHRD